MYVKSYVILLLLVVSIHCLSAQKKDLFMGDDQFDSPLVAQLSAGSFNSSQGLKHGVSLGGLWKHRFTAALFIYLESYLREIINHTPRFMGVYINYLINPNDKFQYGPTVRVGLFNGLFASTILGAEARYSFSKYWSVGYGLGISDRMPVLDFKFNFNLY